MTRAIVGAGWFRASKSFVLRIARTTTAEANAVPTAHCRTHVGRNEVKESNRTGFSTFKRRVGMGKRYELNTMPAQIPVVATVVLKAIFVQPVCRQISSIAEESTHAFDNCKGAASRLPHFHI